MTKQTMNRLEDILNGGELDTINNFINGSDENFVDVIESQSYLQGIFKGFEEFLNLDEQVAIDLFNGLNIELEGIKKMNIVEIIFYPIYN